MTVTRMELVALSELRRLPDNPRTHSTEQLAALRASLREFGFVAPILIDAARNVLGGQARLDAAAAEGFAEVPCVLVEHLSELQREAYRLADNRLAELAGWDRALVSAQLVRLRDAGFEISLTGFSSADIRLDLPQEPFEDEACDLTPSDEDALEPGSVWSLGAHRLMVGDATVAADVERLMDGARADLLLTDPPYGVDYTGGTSEALKLRNDDLSGEDFLRFLSAAISNARAQLRPGAAYYIWHPDGDASLEFRQALRGCGLRVRQCLIWVKNSAVISRQDYHWQHEPCLAGTVPDPDTESCAYGWTDGSHTWHGDRKQSTVLAFDRPLRSAQHPTMKPVKLFAALIGNSTVQGEAVLDLFAGSGTTLIACEELGRRAYCMEADPRYAAVILRRWEALTGAKAQRAEA